MNPRGTTTTTVLFAQASLRGAYWLGERTGWMTPWSPAPQSLLVSGESLCLAGIKLTACRLQRLGLQAIRGTHGGHGILHARECCQPRRNFQQHGETRPRRQHSKVSSRPSMESDLSVHEDWWPYDSQLKPNPTGSLKAMIHRPTLMLSVRFS